MVDVIYPWCYEAKSNNPKGYHLNRSFRGGQVAFNTVVCLLPIAGQEKLGCALLLLGKREGKGGGGGRREDGSNHLQR